MLKAKDLRDKNYLLKISNKKPGYYKWWANKEQLELILKELDEKLENIESYIEKKDNKYCIYVGIAVRESIRARLNWHINDKHSDTRVKTGTLSTLRNSIASIVSHNVYDKEATNKFIDLLEIEYYESYYPIKSDNAKQELHNKERDLLSKNLYILNIQENKFIYALPIKKKLRRLRKISKT